MELQPDLEELMMGMVELPILYNALFPSNNAANTHVAPELVIKASERFKKQELLSAHQADIAKFTSWLEYVDATTARKAKLKQACSRQQEQGFLLRLRESLVEIPPRPPAPLGTLQPIKLAELQLDRQHYGRVLYGNLCAKPFKMTAVLTLLEETQTGDVIKLAIYNAVPSTATVQEVQLQYSEGSRVAIKEPYFKRYKDQTVGLRVNNPGDVVFLESSTISSASGDHDGELRASNISADNTTHMTYDQLRLEGNRAFASGDWRGAVQLYTKSIDKALSLTSSWKLEKSICETKKSDLDPPAGKKKLTMLYSRPDDSVGSKLIHDRDTQKRKSPSKKSGKKRSKQRKGNCDQTRATLTSTKADLKADLKAEGALLAAYSNRSEAWLRLHKYEEAVIDAENALKIDPAHVKSMFRRGKAFHYLQQYCKAVQCLQSALKFSSNDAELQKALKESITADLQSRLGVYNLSSYYLGDFSGSPPNCADYVGPVTVHMLESKYGVGSGQRGLVVTESVKAGDLLLVSNPLAVARAEGQSIEFHLIPATRRMNDASQEDLVTQLYNSASISPRAFHQLQSLYHGSNQGTQPSMELFVPGGAASPGDTCSCFIDKGTPAQPDITKIRQIVEWNAFDEQGYCITRGGRRNLRGFCSGIWVLPSFINHSCLPNASRVHVGDAMLVYASRDLVAGEEICLPYFDILSPLPQRREKALEGWGFICKCPRCNLEASLNSQIRHMTERYCRLEEDAMPSIQEPSGPSGVTKMSSSFMGNGFPRHAAQFLGLASEVETHLCTSAFSHLTAQKKNWIRASYAISYIVGNSTMVDQEGKLLSLTAVLESLLEVFPGNSQTLITATMIMEEVGKQHSVKSKAYKDVEERTLSICRCIYGNQKLPVLRSLIKALQD